ncbi:MAG: class I adenylate-forming enzyme family protein, partial [Rhizobacter sp.]
RVGATIQFATRFDAARLAHAVLHEGITVFQGVPAMYARLAEWAAQTEALLGVRLHHGYGLTEAAPAATRTIGRPPPSDVTAGWPIPGIEVVLHDGNGKPVGPGGRGEVWIRGPNVMKGYFRDPLQTRTAIDGAGWLHTGDIGEFGPAGDLAIVGRIKEMIIRGGFNVYPAEVERAIGAYPGVAQCAVVGRTVPGDEEVIAFVEPIAGRRIDGDDLRGFLRERLAPYKVPSEVVCMERLPATGTGKLLKAELKAAAGAMASAGRP